MMKCKFCNKEYEKKSKYSISGHLAKCKASKLYKETIITKEYLLIEYIKKERSALEIAQEHGYGSAIVIIKLLKDYGLSSRTIKQSKNDREKNKRKNTNIERYGHEHNFSKEHPSRLEWERKMFDEEGIVNVRQRQSVIDKIHSSRTATMYKLGKSIRPEYKDAWYIYNFEVHRLTAMNYKKFFNTINPNDVIRGRGQYHLDHIFSIKDGFDNDISVGVLAHPMNLQMISEFDNLSKGSRSDLTINELYDKIDDYKIII